MSRYATRALLSAVALGASAVPFLAASASAVSAQVVADRFAPVSAPAGPVAAAVTYDEEQVPVGSGVVVSQLEHPDGGTTVTLVVQGLQPDREYGAHVHVNACGPTGDAAGPHFQDEADPVTPSTDPAYANPANEVWLDFTTDAAGNGYAVSTVDWQFGDRPAGSVVIHAEHTHTEPGMAGMAGARLACVTVDF